MSYEPALMLKNQLCFPLYAASRAMMQTYEPYLTKIGLTYPQYLVMLVLWEADNVPVNAIGERLYLDSGTLTPLLKRLESAGLVRRARAERDERVVEITLTAAGKKLKSRALAVPEALACKLEIDSETYLRLHKELNALFRLYQKAAPAKKSHKLKKSKEK